MATITQITDPEARFVNTTRQTPANGRGFWNRQGIDWTWRYEYQPNQPKIGTQAEKSLAHWAVAAGCYGYQIILNRLGHLRDLSPSERGLYGPATRDAVKAMQSATRDPADDRPLYVDGTIGQSDARALLTPIIDAAETEHGIPDRLLRGETNLESRLDLGAVGYYIYYSALRKQPDGTLANVVEYRGVDRGASQINSASNAHVTWAQSYDPYFAVDWSAERMRGYYDLYKRRYPEQATEVLWDAALLAHNNPTAAGSLARNGLPPTDSAAKYVNEAKAARY